MTARIRLLLLGILVFSAALTIKTGAFRTSAQQNGEPQLQVSQEDAYAKQVREFQPIKNLLIEKGVPFEPEHLLSPNWKSLLQPKLAQMAEMYQTRSLSNRVAGVEIANVLYLPEKVEITGDTIFLANRIIFEGKDAVLKGNHAIYFLPLAEEGGLGTTLEAAVRQQSVEFVAAKYFNHPPPPKHLRLA